MEEEDLLEDDQSSEVDLQLREEMPPQTALELHNILLEWQERHRQTVGDSHRRLGEDPQEDHYLSGHLHPLAEEEEPDTEEEEEVHLYRPPLEDLFHPQSHQGGQGLSFLRH
jgi:hypothetical protein